jgi:hypothetical protein
VLVTDALADLVSREHGELYVKHDQIGLFEANELKGLAAAARVRGRISRLTRDLDDERAQGLIIVDDEKMAAVPLTHGHSSSGFRGCRSERLTLSA